MPEILKDDDGNEKTVYTQAELDAERKRLETEYQGKLVEKENHLKEKLDEFVQGKKKVDDKEKDLDEKGKMQAKEWEDKIAEAKKISEDAVKQIEVERQARFDALRNHIFEQYGGIDPEVRKRLQEKWDLINIPIANDEDVKKRAKMAAEFSGLDTSGTTRAPFPGISGFSGSYAAVPDRDKKVSEDDHQKFKDELGLGDIIPKKENK